MKRFFILLLCYFILPPLPAQEKYAGGLAFDDEAYETTTDIAPLKRDLNASRLPARASVKMYAPTPGNQGQYNNCVGWSSSYAARSIIFNKQRGVTQADQVNANAFSPAFTYRLISPDNSCSTPTSIEHALRSMKEKGTVPQRDFDYNCPGTIPGKLYSTASSYTIDNYNRLFHLKDPEKLKLLSLKNALAEGNPVIIGMKCTPSFERADGQEVWLREEPVETKTFFGHAMCVVGYDNKKFGGAFEIMNSWGQRWGQGGFIWVRYKDFIHFVKYAYLPRGEGALLASSKAPKKKASNDPAKSAHTSTRPAINTKSVVKKSTQPASSQFGQTSSERFDLAGEVKMLLSDGQEMATRLYGNVYRTKSHYPAGTKFRLYLSSVKNSYVYVIGMDAKYQTAQLFPRTKTENAWIEAGSEAIAIPDARHYIQLDPSAAERDYLCVIFSKKELDLTLIQQKISAATGNLPSRIQSVLGRDLVSARNIQYENGRIAFSALKDPGTVSTLIIETRRGE